MRPLAGDMELARMRYCVAVPIRLVDDLLRPQALRAFIQIDDWHIDDVAHLLRVDTGDGNAWRRGTKGRVLASRGRSRRFRR